MTAVAKELLLSAFGALLVALGLAAGTCSRATPTTPPAADTSDAGDVCARACAILASVGCSVGTHPRCAEACRLDQTQGPARQLDPACIVEAGVAHMQTACGIQCANGGP